MTRMVPQLKGEHAASRYFINQGLALSAFTTYLYRFVNNPNPLDGNEQMRPFIQRERCLSSVGRLSETENLEMSPSA